MARLLPVLVVLLIGGIFYVSLFRLDMDPLFPILASSLLFLLFFAFLLVRRTTMALQEGRDEAKSRRD